MFPFLPPSTRIFPRHRSQGVRGELPATLIPLTHPLQNSVGMAETTTAAADNGAEEVIISDNLGRVLKIKSSTITRELLYSCFPRQGHHMDAYILIDSKTGEQVPAQSSSSGGDCSNDYFEVIPGSEYVLDQLYPKTSYQSQFGAVKEDWKPLKYMPWTALRYGN